MKKGFTLVEVSILFVIFLIVAFLVAPLSLDDTMQAKHTSKWRNVQLEFSNIYYSINTEYVYYFISYYSSFFA
jgi:type II secretory pathway pseudopilin PulG